MVTKYPGAIDGYSEIRVVRDGIEEVIARDHNDNRSAILAIERTLGPNPQGVYGRVVDRLNAADTDFAEHISGAAHRHVADHIDYPGSSPSAFADGYMLIPAKLGRTVSEMVARIGASTPAGASGADKVGITPYTDPYLKYAHPSTQVRGQVLGIQNALAENATLLERTLGAFVVDGMAVTDPYATGNTARVAPGHIVSDGRLLRFNGGDVAVPFTGGDLNPYYVYAVINNGSVSIGIDDATLPSMDPLNPTVLLHKIVRVSDGGVWHTNKSADIRRYGLLVNNKNFFSVGKTPSGGKDGYGCDFLSLKAAIEYVRALTPSSKLVAPLRIELVTDIIITDDSELDIRIVTDGLTIDGCGKQVIATTGSPHALFSIQANDVKIENLTLVSNCGPTPQLTFARLGTESSVDNLHIDNCGIIPYWVGSQADGDMFLYFGETSGSLTVFHSYITDNVACVANGGIVCAATSPIAQVLRDSKITGNIIQQSALASAASPGIQASVNCVVSDNLIIGGYVEGIRLNAPVNTRVSNNTVLGTDYSTIAMSTGIAIWAPGSGNGYGAIITHNIVRGVNIAGIDNKTGAGAADQTVIANNTIDNGDISPPPSPDAYGVRVCRFEVPVLSNNIIWMGRPVERANFVVGNDIYGHGTASGDGILCVPGSTQAVVCNNRIYNLIVDANVYYAGSAINVNGSSQAVVSGNEIRNCSSNLNIGGLYAGITMGRGTEATITGNLISYPTVASNNMYGISDIGDDSVVCANTIVNMSIDPIMASAAGALRLVIVGNKAHNCGRHGINADSTIGSIIANNQLVVDDPGVTNPSVGILGFSSFCIVSNNFVYGYGSGGYYGISGVGGDDTIVSGNLVANLHTDTQGAINLASGWANLSVVGNVVHNTRRYGIDLGGAQYSLIASNYLSANTAADAYDGIRNVGSVSLVANNQILGYGLNTFRAGIRVASSQSAIQIIGNNIVGQGGDCIDLAAATVCSVVGNVLQGNTHSNSAINNYGGVNTLANNQALYCGASTSSNIIYAYDSASTDPLIIGNQLILCLGTGIYCNGADRCMIVGNDLIGVDGSATSGIQSFGNSSLVVGNVVRQYGFGGYPIGTFSITYDFIVANNIVSDANGATSAGIIVGASCRRGIIIGNVVGDPYVGASVPFDGIDVNDAMEIMLFHNSIQGTSSSGSSYGIRDLGAFGMAGGNYLVLTNGGGISVSGSSDVLVFSNFIEQVGANGIYAAGCSSLSIVGNRIHTSTPNVWNAIEVTGYYALISNNTVYNHYVGILLHDGCGYCVVSGNSLIGPNYGIQIGTTFSAFGRTNVVGNLVGFCIQGIIVFADEMAVTGNVVTRYSDYGIDVSFLDSVCAVGNFVVGPDASLADGMDFTSATTSLGCGNWAEGGATGNGIIVSGGGVVMTGNLSHGGLNSAGWAAGGYIDVDNRFFA